MSLIPRNSSNNPTPFTPFSQEFWDNFFSHDSSFPFPHLPFQLPSFLSPLQPRTLPYSELSIQTSGNLSTRLECKELPEAHLIVAELPGIDKHQVEVTAEDGGGSVVVIRDVDGRFSWRMRLPEEGGGVKMELMSWSMENGVLTVVVPKHERGFGGWERGDGNRNGGRDVRVVEITGSDE